MLTIANAVRLLKFLISFLVCGANSILVAIYNLLAEELKAIIIAFAQSLNGNEDCDSLYLASIIIFPYSALLSEGMIHIPSYPESCESTVCSFFMVFLYNCETYSYATLSNSFHIFFIIFTYFQWIISYYPRRRRK